MNRYLLITDDGVFEARLRAAVANDGQAVVQTMADVALTGHPADLLGWVGGDAGSGVVGEIGADVVEVVLFGPGVAPTDAFRVAAEIEVLRPDAALVLVAQPQPQPQPQSQSQPQPDLLLAAMRVGIRDILDPTADVPAIRDLLERVTSAAQRRNRAAQFAAPVNFPPLEIASPNPPSAHNHAPRFIPGVRSKRKTDADASARAAFGRRRSDPRLIVVASPKGGVGKTTVATNLAVALGRIAPMSTVLVDLDAQFGDVASAMRLEPEHTLLDAVSAPAAADPMVLKAFLTLHESSTYALCAPHAPEEADLISGDSVTHLLRRLAADFQYVVVDTAPGLDEHALAAFEQATDAVLLCSMDVPSVRGLRKQMDILSQLKLLPERRHMVVNLADRNSGLSIRDIEATTGVPVDSVIPRARELAFSTNQGEPLLMSTNKGPAAKALQRIADACDASREAKPARGVHKRLEVA